MGVILTGVKYPQNCLECRKRRVIHDGDGRGYQLCGLNEDGYLLESWFKAEDLTKTFKAPQCPLKSVEGLIEKIFQLPRMENSEGQDMFQAYDVLRAIKDYCEFEGIMDSDIKIDRPIVEGPLDPKFKNNTVEYTNKVINKN